MDPEAAPAPAQSAAQAQPISSTASPADAAGGFAIPVGHRLVPTDEYNSYQESHDYLRHLDDGQGVFFEDGKLRGDTGMKGYFGVIQQMQAAGLTPEEISSELEPPAAEGTQEGNQYVTPEQLDQYMSKREEAFEGRLQVREAIAVEEGALRLELGRSMNRKIDGPTFKKFYQPTLNSLVTEVTGSAEKAATPDQIKTVVQAYMRGMGLEAFRGQAQQIAASAQAAPAATTGGGSPGSESPPPLPIRDRIRQSVRKYQTNAQAAAG